MSTETWNIRVIEASREYLDPKMRGYPFICEAVSNQTGQHVYGYGDSELEARQDCYIQMEQERKAEQSG